jgi:ATP-binding cassette, subfamily B, bacterial
VTPRWRPRAAGGVTPRWLPRAAGGVTARWRRLAGVLVGSGFRAAPWTALACLLLGLGAAVASVTYSIGFRVLIDGAIAHAGGRVALGAVLTASLFTASWLFLIVGGTEGTLLTDRVNLMLGVRIARVAATVPTLEHFEDSAMLGRLEQLTANRRTLAGAPRQVIALVGQTLRAVGIVVLLATVYVPVLFVPVLALAPALSDRWAARLQRRADDALAEDRRLLDALFSLATGADSAREVRTYGITEELARRHAELGERVRRRAVRAAVLSSALEATGWIVFAAGLVGAIVVLVLRAAHGHVSPGQVVMAVSLLRRAQTQISRSTDTAGSFNTSVTTAGHLLWFEDHAADRPTAHRRPTPVPARMRDGLHLEDVVFAYPGAEEPALGPIDLELPAGRTIALVGENGAGKTTLVKLLCGMYRPRAGRIAVDGVDLQALDAGEWRERVSAAFQDFVRFQLRLGESVGVGDLPRLGDQGVVRSALARADAGALEQELADGLESWVGNRFTGGRELSGGQWQRLALARGLMRGSPLLVVLDEPTASLDAPTETALFDRYAQAARAAAAAQGTVTLLVSHRFSTARSADLIVVLESGRVVESGSHDALIRAGGTYAELFELQARAYR